MARIRSLHPGIFTDDRYMGLSLGARELIKGIWCEADDQGVFEWKPLTLKARILPADAVDMEALLVELIGGKFVSRFELDGDSFGLVRNFRHFQRPKKPNATYLLPPEFRTYVGLDAATEEPKPTEPAPVPHQFPTEGGKSPQMEDGGGSGEGKKQDARPNGSGADDDPEVELFRRGKAVLGPTAGGMIRNLLKAKGGKVPLARAAIEQASTKENPKEFIGRIVAGPPDDGGAEALRGVQLLG